MFRRRLLQSLIFSSVLIGSKIHAEDAKIYPLLKTQSGQQFSEVRVLKVEPDSITIMHKDGGCRLKVEDLPTTLQQELGISYNDSAITYRKKRDSERSVAQKSAQLAHNVAARKRQRAMISRIVEQQEQELSQVAKVKVVEKHADGYLCKVVYPITIDVTQQITTTLGAKKTIIVGKKTIYPKEFEAELIYLISQKKLGRGREYAVRILHEEPYSYTPESGYTAHIQRYKVIKP
jgi:hypothetical protein